MSALFEQFEDYLFYLKLGGTLLTLLLLAGAIYCAVYSGWLPALLGRTREIMKTAPHAKKRVLKAWKTVLAYLAEDNVHAWKLAVIQSDVLLDEALRAAGIPGKNTGERLKAVDRGAIPNLDALWDAHKLRNTIAHEMDFPLDKNTAERAVKTFEETFRHFGLID